MYAAMAIKPPSIAAKIFGPGDSGKKMICLVVLIILGLSGLAVLGLYKLPDAMEFWKIAITPALMGILGYVNGSKT